MDGSVLHENDIPDTRASSNSPPEGAQLRIEEEGARRVRRAGHVGRICGYFHRLRNPVDVDGPRVGLLDEEPQNGALRRVWHVDIKTQLARLRRRPKQLRGTS